MRWVATRNYYRLVAKARLRREESLTKMKTIMNQIKEMETYGTKIESVLLLTLHDLCHSLSNGDVSPSYVLHAYLEKALDATQKFNCITEFLPECLTQLAELQGMNKGILYGIPVSIKDNINYKGHDSTCGLGKFLNRPAGEDSVIVQVLKKQGAIPFVKTNVPQTLLRSQCVLLYNSLACSNPIYGQTINPHDTKRTSGGSSGGEAALIAAGGSILGIGTDLCGSIRFPAACCGICAFKPTANRLSKIGLSGGLPGQKTFESMAGPLAKDVESLAMCMKALLCEDMFHLDPTVPPVPFNNEIYANIKQMRIGYFESDGYWIPTPSMKRAIMETKQLLEEAGHTLVSFTPPKMYYAMNEIVFPGFFADKGLTLIETLSVEQLWKHHVAVMTYREEYIKAWGKHDIEVLLCPSVGPAFQTGRAGKLSASSSYTIIYNLLNFPAGVVPVTKVTKEDEEELMNYHGYKNDSWDKTFKKAVSGGVGLPLAVQCVALPWHDELCLCFMREVEKLVKKKKGTQQPLEKSNLSVQADAELLKEQTLL
ncbi:fatty-acid amide hydrolase 1-like isoform X5 [Scyliorhinus canicula]|uniref:fatty-acid amide hydrolase 1-like isoform X5 n=1 Tax=Scyliorhinus canicula TaxID=7830 RepID=UPI0018F7C271|nr:fatty-acid amide hydrolase 1-like isoform X5 [Scyliorhinus canicula]